MGDERLHEKEVVAVLGVRPAKNSLDGRLHALFSGEPANDVRRMTPPLTAPGINSSDKLTEPPHEILPL